jgi:hypothetical protein
MIKIDKDTFEVGEVLTPRCTIHKNSPVTVYSIGDNGLTLAWTYKKKSHVRTFTWKFLNHKKMLLPVVEHRREKLKTIKL